jgi:prolipoprotein diacylglyceryltransferase
MEFTLVAAVAMGIVPFYLVLYWEAKRGNAASCTRDLWDIGLTAAMAGLIVGRLAAMIGGGVNPITHPFDILIVRGGVATGPAALATVATVAWLGRSELFAVADGLAPAALAGLAGWHGGCLARGTCLGTPSDLPWAFAQPGSEITRHPVEIYAALALLAGAIVLAVLRSRSRLKPGIAAGSALTYAAFIRLVTDPLRPTLGGGPVGWYLVGMALGIALIIWSVHAGSGHGTKAAPTSGS